MAKNSIQSPSGTRDLYPGDLLKRRYIEKLWRDTSIRHGFEEIDGPTFEHSELYAVKSGEGILNEVFQVFSGKDEAEASRIRGGGMSPYALRPEFTPTLARMYAAKAGSLPKPTKWFWQQNCFRAERQQRGRLREFGQWNCDILGGENDPESRARVDAEAIACVAMCLESAGLTPKNAQVAIGHRKAHERLAEAAGLAANRTTQWIALLDRRSKLPREQFLAEAAAIGLSNDQVAQIENTLQLNDQGGWDSARQQPDKLANALKPNHGDINRVVSDQIMFNIGDELTSVQVQLRDLGCQSWCELDLNIARGLAYYTGTVFEVLADGERAIAGGGRYDNLIELFGGPPTPAVGFGMGDVVLSLVLQDRGLLPEGDALMDALSRPSASYRPDVFVIPAGQSPEDQEAAAAQVRPLVARLRRGVESKAYQDNEKRRPWDTNRYEAASGGSPPLHARSSSKATKNIGKLLQDAAGQKAKLAVIVENAEEVTIKDLRTNQQDAGRTKIAELGKVVAERLGMG